MSAARLRSPAGYLPLVLVDAALLVFSFVAAAYVTLLIDPYLYFYDEGGSGRLAPVIAVMILAAYLADLYSRRRRVSRIYRAQQISLVAGVALLFEAFVSWVDPDAILPRNLTVIGMGLCVLSLFTWRTVLDAVLVRFSGPRAILLLGGGQTLHDLAEHVARHPELNLAVSGSLSNDPSNAVAPVLGPLERVRAVARELKPDLIIAGIDENREQLPIGDLLDLRFSGVTIEEAGPACELICQRISVRDLRPSRVLFTQDFEPNAPPIVITVADFVIAAALLAAASPFALFWAAVLKLSGYRAIVRRSCSGLRGAAFTSRRLTLPAWGRVARVAAALRIDRYPDLWNVLAGRMSMVGPKPATTAVGRELCRIIPVYEYRSNVRPGIASWAQIHRDRAETVADPLREIEYDLYYVRHRSPFLYASVLLNGLRQRLS